MKVARWSARLCISLFVAVLTVSLVGCGGSGTPTPPATPAAPAAAAVTIPTVSAIDMMNAIDQDPAKGWTAYAGKTIRLVNVFANTWWEDDKMLDLSVFNAEKMEAGGVPSEATLRGQPIKQMVCPFFFKVRIDDPKLVEGIKCGTTQTIDGKARTDYFDVLEVECEFEKFADGEIIFKNPKFTKK